MKSLIALEVFEFEFETCAELNWSQLKFALDTAQLYVGLHERYRIPHAVHKILMHGSQGIEIVLRGMLSQSQEGKFQNFACEKV